MSAGFLQRCGVSALAFVATYSWFAVPSVSAQTPLSDHIDPALREDVEYARALTDMGLPDYAKIIIDRLKQRSPEIEPLIRIIEIQGFLALGKFDDVRAIIAREKDPEAESTWGMKMAMADAFYAWGRYDEARGIYESLFKKYPEAPPAGLTSFYMNSAYRYAQMLIMMGNEAGACQAYEQVLKVLPKNDRERRHIRRQVVAEMAELLVKQAEATDKEDERAALLKQADALCTELLWVQDLWFGKAIVMMAHARLIQGDVDGANKLVDEYWPQLKQIDDILKEQAGEIGEDLTRLSPMAECRYLLGVIMHDKAMALLGPSGGDRNKALELLAGKMEGGKRTNGALQHFLNVFIKYPGTPWAPDAGRRANEVEETLRTVFRAEVKKSVTPEMMAKVEQNQFQGARSLYSQNQFENAVEAYEKVLNLFPESDTAVAALGEFSRCYIELAAMEKPGAEWYVDTILHYLAERFGGRDATMNKAGEEILRAATLYGERNRPERKEATDQLFFDYFPRHPLAPALLFRAGEQKFADGDLIGAIACYGRVITNAPASSVFFDAMNRLAHVYNKLDRPADEIKTLRTYIARLEAREHPGQALPNAMYRLASVYRKVGVEYVRKPDKAFQEAGNKYLASAIAKYDELTKLLTGNVAKYQDSKGEADLNVKLMEGALFNMGAAYSMRSNEPEPALRAYKEKAIQIFESLGTRYPKSEFAPLAINQVGTLWTVLDNPDKAKNALEQLQQRYPESPEAKNALFLLGKSLLELGRRQQAVRIFKDMFTGEGAYSDAQLLTAGNELLAAGERDIALEAFEKVLKQTQDPAHRQPATIGKARILIEQEKYEEAGRWLSDFMEQYPRSGYTKDAARHLGRAYAELGMREADADKRFDLFNAAVVALRRARQLERTEGGAAALDLDVARMMELKAQAEEKHGSPEKAAAYRGDAVATYQTLILLGDASGSEIKPHIERAYRECLPLLLAIGKWSDAIEDADRFLELFPGSPYAADMRTWKSQAQMKSLQTGNAAPAPAPAPTTAGSPPERQATEPAR